jgi:cytochrome c6
MKLLTILLLIAGLFPANPVLAADMARGQRIYMGHCVSCHGPRGLSFSPSTPSFAKGEGLMQPDMVLMQTIKNGRNGQPPFFGILKDQEILDSLAYIRTLR